MSSEVFQTSQTQWLTLIILAAQEAEIQRLSVQGEPREKPIETPISIDKLGVVVYVCHPSY
jgi:hypothetical protein